MTIQVSARTFISSKNRTALLLFLMFLTGTLLGAVFARHFSMFAVVFSGVQDGQSLQALLGRDMADVFVSCGKLLLLIFLLSFQRWGAFGIPAVFGIEGFCFGGTVAGLISFMGPRGAVLAVLLLLFRLLLVIPYSFLLGVWAIEQSLSFDLPGDGRKKAGVFFCTLALMLLASFLECTLGRWLGGMYYLTFGV